MDGKTLHFHYDTEKRLLAETTETGTPIREYIYAANQRIALVDYQQNTQGVVYFMVNDHLGTPQLLLDVQQQVVWSVDQSPFGEVRVEGSVEQPLRFPGQYADVETGYSYNYFRDYDPTLGRYIESDPIGLEAGVNTFGYVMGNPVNGFDLWGLQITLPSSGQAQWQQITREVNSVTAHMTLNQFTGFTSYVGYMGDAAVVLGPQAATMGQGLSFVSSYSSTWATMKYKNIFDKQLSAGVSETRASQDALATTIVSTGLGNSTSDILEAALGSAGIKEKAVGALGALAGSTVSNSTTEMVCDAY